MEGLVSLFQFVVANGPQFLAALVAVLVGLVALLHAIIGLFMLVPGAQPEAGLQKLVDKLQAFVDFVSKFSRKPVDAPKPVDDLK